MPRDSITCRSTEEGSSAVTVKTLLPLLRENTDLCICYVMGSSVLNSCNMPDLLTRPLREELPPLPTHACKHADGEALTDSYWRQITDLVIYRGKGPHCCTSHMLPVDTIGLLKAGGIWSHLQLPQKHSDHCCETWRRVWPVSPPWWRCCVMLHTNLKSKTNWFLTEVEFMSAMIRVASRGLDFKFGGLDFCFTSYCILTHLKSWGCTLWAECAGFSMVNCQKSYLIYTHMSHLMDKFISTNQSALQLINRIYTVKDAAVKQIHFIPLISFSLSVSWKEVLWTAPGLLYHARKIKYDWWNKHNFSADVKVYNIYTWCHFVFAVCSFELWCYNSYSE